MKWFKKIISASFEEKDPQFGKAKQPKVFVQGCGWGTLTQLEANGSGYIKHDSGGGSLIRNWNHFFKLVEIIDTDIEE